jgi:hypothetical protein
MSLRAVALLGVLLCAGQACEHARQLSSASDAAPRQEAKKVTVSPNSFRAIKALIFERGDRQTYCNMYNDNPHLGFEGFDVFLNPDTGQANINCDPSRSDFNEMVIRDWRTQKLYFLLKLDLATEKLLFEPEDAAALESYFTIMLSSPSATPARPRP